MNARRGVRKQFAKSLRKSAGVCEDALWQKLRNRQFGFKVRRQHPIGNYVLDFYIPQAKLCVEVDGEFHEARTERDAIRDAYLATLGIETLRIKSWDEISDVEGAARTVYVHCCERLGIKW